MVRRGGRLLAISIDPPERSREVVQRRGLNFTILSDPERSTIGAYGLVHEGAGSRGSDIAIPALALIRRDGRIVWRRKAALIQDRPDPDEVMATLHLVDDGHAP